MTLETERLILRELTEDDQDALLRVLGDPDIMIYYPQAFDAERVRGWIGRNKERYRVFGFGLWAVCLKDSGELIGDCGLTMQPIHGAIKPEIGYHIRADQQKKGYAKEAAIAVRDWAFCNTPFRVLHSYMKHANVPSAKTAIAYGCRQVDSYVDEFHGPMDVYAITKDEWAAL